LAERVAENGVVLSEFPMSTTPMPGNFPRRNRIIAGLSVGTVVIEGDDKSGALITARLAAEEGRDVFALPGPVTSRLSHAPHRLIKAGAKLVETIDDILEEIPGFEPTTALSRALASENLLSELQQWVLEYIGGTTLLKETLMKKLELSTPAFTELLLDLELKGWIKSQSGGTVSRA
jgi:DNA processing protein